MTIEIVNKSKNELPSYATEGSAGMDLRASLEAPVVIKPGQRMLIPTGIQIGLPVGYEAQVRPRSGLALKHGITVLNTPGTIDADYRGDIGVILVNQGEEPFVINNGDRIAQLVVSTYEKVELDLVLMLEDTPRGAGAFGHSGVK